MRTIDQKDLGAQSLNRTFCIPQPSTVELILPCVIHFGIAYLELVPISTSLNSVDAFGTSTGLTVFSREVLIGTASLRLENYW